MDCSLRSETLVPLANLPVGKVSKLFVALKERPTLKVSDKRGWAQSLVREQTHEGNTRADAPRRRVTAESYGFKAWEVRQLVILPDENVQSEVFTLSRVER
jgi:hypothetical protein